MKKNLLVLCVCAFAVLFSGCAPEPEKEFFKDRGYEYELVENVIFEPEFPEYLPDVEIIYASMINNNDENFHYNPDNHVLQKKENGEWRDVRSDKHIFFELPTEIPAKHASERSPISLNGYPKPLPEGEYRIGLGDFETLRYAWCEFTIKEPEGAGT